MTNPRTLMLAPVLFVALVACGPVEYALSAPPKLQAHAGEPLSLTVKVASERPRRHPVTVSLLGLPASVTAQPATIAPDAAQAVLPLTVVSTADLPITAAVTVRSASGKLTHDQQVQLKVTPPAATHDTRFGQSGRVHVVLKEREVGDVQLQLGRRLLLGGSHGGRASVSALNLTGAADPSFGRGGVTFLPVGGDKSVVSGLRLLNTGQVIAAGAVYRDFTTEEGTTNSFAQHIFVTRLDEQGQLDPLFGRAGVTTLKFDSMDQVIGDMEIQPDGKILLVVKAMDYPVDGRGMSGTANAIVRLLPDGAPDPHFGQGGRINLAYEDLYAPAELALTREGKVLVGLEARVDRSGDDEFPDKFALMRLNPDGSRDNAFGQGGLAVLQVGSESSSISDLAELSGGKIVAVGDFWSNSGPENGLAVVRFNPDGGVDSTFGQDGQATVQVQDGRVAASKVRVARDGQLVVAGHYDGNANNDGVLVARLLKSGNLDQRFSYDGQLIDAVATHPQSETLFLDEDGIVVTTVSTPDSDAPATERSEFAAVRYWN